MLTHKKKTILVVMITLLLIYPVWLGIEYLQIFLQINNRLAMASGGTVVVYRWGEFVPFTPEKVVVNNLEWSPDGTQIAFIYWEGYRGYSSGMNDVYIGMVDVEDGTFETIYSFRSGVDDSFFCPDLLDLAWSPDGTKILFTVFPNRPEYQLYLLDVETGNAEPTQLSFDDSLADQAVYLDWNPGPYPLISVGDQIFRINADFSSVTPVTQGRNPKWWSGDGQTITYEQYEIYSSDLYRINVDEGTPSLILEGTDNGAWSPDGHFMAYTYGIEYVISDRIRIYDSWLDRYFGFYIYAPLGELSWAAR